MIKNLMYLTILTFFVILVWIALSIYRNFNPAEPTLGKQVVPIPGSFDFETIQRLKGRTVVPANFEESFVSTPSPTIVNTRSTETSTSEVNVVPTISPSGSTATSSAN